MTFESCHRPFFTMALLAAPAVAALVLLTPAAIAPVRAQAAQQAALSESAKSEAAKSETAKSDGAKSDSVTPAAEKSEQGNVAAVDHTNSPPPTSLTDKAIEKMKQVARSASDIFSRVPCLPPKGAPKSMGSLPHVAGKLAAGEPVLIIAFGSS